jgi:hypothetical protein
VRERKTHLAGVMYCAMLPIGLWTSVVEAHPSFPLWVLEVNVISPGYQADPSQEKEER